MSDKYTLQLKNFRSIREAEIDIAPLTVVYGPNGSGKSSLIYGLLTLKNFLTDPNRNMSGLFSYPGISLGGYDDVVFNHIGDESIEASLSVSTPGRGVSRFILGVGESGGKSSIYVDEHDTKLSFDLAVNVPFPYRLDQSVNALLKMEWYVWWEEEYDFTYETEIGIGWNGVKLNLNHVKLLGWGEGDVAIALLKWANRPMEMDKSIYL